LDGIKIGVTSSFEITHESVGQPNQEFFDSKIKFVEKYKDVLPLDLKPTSIYTPEVKIKNVKLKGKVGVIIPTKGNIELLIQCIDSFYEYCNPKLFDIFIADTGSTEEEINVIEELVNSLDNIKLIKYDYYNFAKINNDVVKNHLDKTHQYILFCNNDIKLTSDVISGMLNVYNIKSKVGTVGCRLHYDDNTIQHDGILVGLKLSNMGLTIVNRNRWSYYNFNKDITNVIGNTGGLMMINTNTFKQIGMFNEEYIDCFEDVELNLKLLLVGFENYNVGTHTAYHYESKTRYVEGNMKVIKYDFNQTLTPFIKKNLMKLKDKILFTQ
jgi:GT2 family glycosyltransferase